MASSGVMPRCMSSSINPERQLQSRARSKRLASRLLRARLLWNRAEKTIGSFGMRWIWSWSMLMFFTLPVWAVDWPQWLGPNRDNSSSEKIAAWTAPPKILWRQPVGEGNSSPVVADGRVFVHAKISGMDKEELSAFDAKTGKKLWDSQYPRAAVKCLDCHG